MPVLLMATLSGAWQRHHSYWGDHLWYERGSLSILFVLPILPMD